eukprot:CAMPEP_0170199166 /NCGR_PEP_ID=MMETSP0040_2-20121228/69190_1 /TAXON_ID=641309 /ORGANISM="Lotharella oceanica, Strain CCMP622" /LENGTH=112 /DNA_ID=CAMNT_0010449259 /DNA_START=178 /DNA_END=516 /DNA_ORIENTATION=+
MNMWWDRLPEEEKKRFQELADQENSKLTGNPKDKDGKKSTPSAIESIEESVEPQYRRPFYLTRKRKKALGSPIASPLIETKKSSKKKVKHGAKISLRFNFADDTKHTSLVCL